MPSLPDTGFSVLALDDAHFRARSPYCIIREIMSRTNSRRRARLASLEPHKKPNIVRKIGDGLSSLQSHKSQKKSKSEFVQKPCDAFDLIVGSGIGGLIATLLASPFELTLDTIGECLDKVLPILFSDTEDSPDARARVLEIVLKDIVAEHHPSRNPQVLFQSGGQRPTCTAIVIVIQAEDMGTLPFYSWSGASSSDAVAATTVEVLRAAIAYQGLVSPVNISGSEFVAPTMKSGNPTKLIREFLSRPGTLAFFGYSELGLLLSIGGGHPDTIRLPKGDSRNIYPTLKALCQDCEEQNVKSIKYFHAAFKPKPNPFCRLSVQQGMQILDLSTPNLHGVVTARTRTYVGNAASSTIDDICNFLERRSLAERHDPSKSLPRHTQAIPKDFHVNVSSGGLKLLSLDGGGLLGLSELLILQEVMPRIAPGKAPHEVFDLIAGSGSGGLIALLLGRLQLSVKDAIQIYQKINHGLWESVVNEEAPDPTAMTLAFETRLYEVLMELSGHPELPMHHQGCKTFVLVNVAKNLNAKLSCIQATYPRINRSPNSWTVQEAIRATTAIRPIFTDMKVGMAGLAVSYCGTDVANNNPTQHLIDEASIIWPETPLSCVVSIGAGDPGYIAMPEPSAWPNSAELREVLKKICRNCIDTHEDVEKDFHRNTAKTPHNPYFRFSIEQGLQGVSPYSLSDVEAQAAHAIAYLNRAVTEIQV